MPHWNVEGTDKRTGKYTSILVDAETQQEAEQKAFAQGVKVTSVRPARVHAQPVKTMAAAVNRAAIQTPVSEEHSSPNPLPTQQSRLRRLPKPILIGGGCFVLVIIVAVVIAAVGRQPQNKAEMETIGDLFQILCAISGGAAVISGVAVAYGFLASKRFDRWTAIFLIAMVACGITELLSGLSFISLLISLVQVVPSSVALFARFVRQRAGKWQRIYTAATVTALILPVLAPILLRVFFKPDRVAAVIVIIALAIFYLAMRMRAHWKQEAKELSAQRYCQSCESIGQPKSKRPGSNDNSFALLVLCFPAFFAYEVWRRTRPLFVCGVCGKSGMISVTTPVGKAALEKTAKKMRVGPTKYQVSGVDKASGLDVVEYIVASSSENAKVKVELKGVIVTAVDLA